MMTCFENIDNLIELSILWRFYVPIKLLQMVICGHDVINEDFAPGHFKKSGTLRSVNDLSFATSQE